MLLARRTSSLPKHGRRPPLSLSPHILPPADVDHHVTSTSPGSHRRLPRSPRPLLRLLELRRRRVPIGSRKPGEWRVWLSSVPGGGYGGGWRGRGEGAGVGMGVSDPHPNPAGAIPSCHPSSCLSFAHLVHVLLPAGDVEIDHPVVDMAAGHVC